MKKPSNSKKSAPKKISEKGKDLGELRKPTKLKPLTGKEKKNWKNDLDDEEDDFAVEDDIKLDTNFDDDDDDDFYDDDY